MPDSDDPVVNIRLNISSGCVTLLLLIPLHESLGLILSSLEMQYVLLDKPQDM